MFDGVVAIDRLFGRLDGLLPRLDDRTFASELPRAPWRSQARPGQLAPGSPGAADARQNWYTWLVLAGRGFGKTRTGAEWVKERVENGARHIILAGPTAADIRDVMVEGESGLLSLYSEAERPSYEPSKNRITWNNGARAVLLTAEKPDRFRGKQGDTVWCDELASWKYPEAWDMLQFSMRLGSPRFMVTTTPRPIPVLKKIMEKKSTAITRGSTFENKDNLAEEFIAEIMDEYEGTRLGRQELYAEILDDHPGALWRLDRIDKLRLKKHPPLTRIVVAVDPSVADNKTAASADKMKPGDKNEKRTDETGIVVVGIGECWCRHQEKPDLHMFILADESVHGSPDEWAQRVVKTYKDWRADRVIAEVNQGGALVEALIRTVDSNTSYRAVHASKGKKARAEPIAALYEQGKVHHVGNFSRLEDQLTSWDPIMSSRSPDRLDALVWGATELMLNSSPASSLPEDADLGHRRTFVDRDESDDDDWDKGWK